MVQNVWMNSAVHQICTMLEFGCVLILQPDRVMEFCNNNDLQLIVRAHECVMDGFERFAQGHLITLFSATNYCGMFKAEFLSVSNCAKLIVLTLNYLLEA